MFLCLTVVCIYKIEQIFKKSLQFVFVYAGCHTLFPPAEGGRVKVYCALVYNEDDLIPEDPNEYDE